MHIALLGLVVVLNGPGARAADRLSAEVLWDRYGVPHVYAANEADLFYGFGFAQMKSHGELMLKLYAEGRGRAAEYYGAEELPSDRWMAINGVPDRAKDWLASQTPTFRADLEAFAAGMNAYATRHPEVLSLAARRVLPVSGVDVVGYAHRLFQYVYIAPQSLTEHLPADSPEPAGSNGWAIAPSHSADGHTLMLMNPHLPWPTGWSTYYEAQLSAPGVNLYGATQVGLPVLRFVFSDQLGITNTVDDTNGVTFYRATPAEGGYRFDGAVKPFVTRRETLKIRRADGGYDHETMEVRSTVQGPVVAERDGAPIAMRVAGLDRPRALDQYWKMETARDFAGYQAALKMMQVPTFNIVYGDRDGHIEYLFDGLVPRHTFGGLAYWRGVVPGDSARTLWNDYLSYDELPNAIDPSGGTVQNSNGPPWNAGFPAVLDPHPYRAYIADDLVSLRTARDPDAERTRQDELRPTAGRPLVDPCRACRSAASRPGRGRERRGGRPGPAGGGGSGARGPDDGRQQPWRLAVPGLERPSGRAQRLQGDGMGDVLRPHPAADDSGGLRRPQGRRDGAGRRGERSGFERPCAR